ncbi:MAG: glycerophosphodiester phosphodiesterase [Elusimicrobia bacterium]|nr:glycerophosphodiester phosphodiesterase [Elusimicrobiota bacterium]
MLLIAHRGASGTHPENTMAAFRAAWAAGAKAFEFDVQRSKDGVLVVIHDNDLTRTGLDPRAVRDLTLAELKSHDFGRWFDHKFAGERMPTLEELIDATPSDCLINLEIKQAEPVYEGIEKDVLDFLNKRPMVKARTAVSSFHHDTLKALRRLDGKVRIGLLPGRLPIEPSFELAKELSAESLNVNQERLTPEWVERAHKAGMRVLVYTIVKQEQILRAAELGADGVFSNFPGLKVPP